MAHSSARSGISRLGSACFHAGVATRLEGMEMRQDTLRLLAGCLCAALVGAVESARAVDGVIEINDASILAAGGYPGVIGAPGSYVLTSNLIPPPGSNAINVFAPDVTLDLNGFSVSTGGGGAIGINGTATGLTVRNGTVSGFGTGIAAGSASKVFQVRAAFNIGTGISAFQCLIVESVVEGNGTGIQADRCKVENNIVQGNLGVGMLGGSNVIVHNNVLGNLAGGILTFGGSTIQENVVQDNIVFGISDGIFGPPPPPPPAPFPSRVEIRGNAINNNGGPPGGPGVSLAMPALVTDNTIAGNTGSGVVCGAGCVLNGNSINSNNTSFLPLSGGAVLAAGSNATDNAISFNFGFGINLPATAGYSQNTLNANIGPDMLLAPVFGPHPTSGFMNLCTGIPGPAPTCP
jgi:hypothetical protein